MKKAIMCAACFVAVGAVWAQDRTGLQVRQQDVKLYKVEIVVRPDGGCLGMAEGYIVPPSNQLLVSRGQYPFNGGACNNIQNAGQKMLEKDFGAGDGGVP